jgi:hypothetical protein
LTTTVATAAIALALLLVPISYERTVGHLVTVSLSGATLGEEKIHEIVTDLSSSLGTEAVRVSMFGDGYLIKVSSPIRSRAKVEAAAAGLSKSLARGGMGAEVSVTPRVERVTGNVYAAARWTFVDLSVRRSGRSAQQVEEDLRAQLSAAGYENPQVSVDLGGDETSIRIESTSEQGGETRQRIRKVTRKGDGGDFDVQLKDLDYQPEPGMTDEEIRQDILRELASQGMGEAEVTVENGEIRVEVRKEGECN